MGQVWARFIFMICGDKLRGRAGYMVALSVLLVVVHLPDTAPPHFCDAPWGGAAAALCSAAYGSPVALSDQPRPAPRRPCITMRVFGFLGGGEGERGCAGRRLASNSSIKSTTVSWDIFIYVYIFISEGAMQPVPRAQALGSLTVREKCKSTTYQNCVVWPTLDAPSLDKV